MLVRTEKLTPSPYQGEGWGGVNCPNSNGDCYICHSAAEDSAIATDSEGSPEIPLLGRNDNL